MIKNNTSLVSSKGTILILLGIFIFAALISIGGVKAYLHWTDVHYFGEIVAIRNNGFSIKTRENFEKLIFIDEHTVIRKGRKILKRKPQIGEHVIIVGASNQTNSVKARIVRVVHISRR